MTTLYLLSLFALMLLGIGIALLVHAASRVLLKLYDHTLMCQYVFGVVYTGLALKVCTLVYPHNALPLLVNKLKVSMEFVGFMQDMIFLVFAVFILGLFAISLQTVFRNRGLWRAWSLLFTIAAFILFWIGLYVYFAAVPIPDAWFNSSLAYLALSGALSLAVMVFSEDNAKAN